MPMAASLTSTTVGAPGDRQGVDSASPLRYGRSEPHRPRTVRRRPRGCGRSVGRGANTPAIEPRKSDFDRVPTRGVTLQEQAAREARFP
jgi:hypothetical protein